MPGLSETGICNMALERLGDERISSFTEGTRRAQLCQDHYPTLRDAVLREGAWKFARRRAQLDPLDPAHWGYAYRYRLPTVPVCLKVLEVQDEHEDSWTVEGQELLTDATPCHILYVAQVTDGGSFDDAFIDTLAERLAAELAYAVTGSHTAAETHWQRYMVKLSLALASSGKEGSPKRLTLPGLFVDGR